VSDAVALLNFSGRKLLRPFHPFSETLFADQHFTESIVDAIRHAERQLGKRSEVCEPVDRVQVPPKDTGAAKFSKMFMNSRPVDAVTPGGVHRYHVV